MFDRQMPRVDRGMPRVTMSQCLIEIRIQSQELHVFSFKHGEAQLHRNKATIICTCTLLSHKEQSKL